MNFKKNTPAQRLNPYEMGVREYNREDMSREDFDCDDSIMHTLQEALDVHSSNTRPIDDFNQRVDDRQLLDDPVLPLPEGAHPHDPLTQLARAGTQGFGFESVLSIDSSKMISEWEVANHMADWIKGVGSRHNPDTGMVFFVHRTEDHLRPRLQPLRQALGELTIPRLIVTTTAAPQGAGPFEESVVLNPAMVRTNGINSDPGMELL